MKLIEQYYNELKAQLDYYNILIIKDKLMLRQCEKEYTKELEKNISDSLKKASTIQEEINSLLKICEV